MKTFLTHTLIIAVIGFGLTGCIEHRPSDDLVAAQDPDDGVIAVSSKPKGLRVYEGVIPCADCSGIYQRLALKGDSTGIFRLTEVFRDATEDGDETIVTTGSWKRYKTKIDGQPALIFYLSEGSLKDSSRIQRYEVASDRIVQLDLDGQRVDSTKNYTLMLIHRNN